MVQRQVRSVLEVKVASGKATTRVFANDIHARAASLSSSLGDAANDTAVDVRGDGSGRAGLCLGTDGSDSKDCERGELVHRERLQKGEKGHEEEEVGQRATRAERGQKSRRGGEFIVQFGVMMAVGRCPERGEKLEFRSGE